MKKVKLILKLTLFTMVLLSCNNEEGNESTGLNDSSGKSVTTNTPPPVETLPLSVEDSLFLHEAAMGGLMEVNAAAIARSSAHNSRVKAYAELLYKDHSVANQELKSFADSRNIKLPDSLDNSHKEHLKKLAASGNSLDKTYMAMMVKDHQETVEKFEKASVEVRDELLKSWVDKVLPVLKLHRDSAMVIQQAKL